MPTLKPYQEEGRAFLLGALTRSPRVAVLADDPGLGKTATGSVVKARHWSIARSIVEKGPTAAREPEVVRAVAEFHKHYLQRVKSPFWPIMMRALYPR